MQPKRNSCAICRKAGRKGSLHDYQTILQSMGHIGHRYAHSKCILNAQQRSLQFRNRKFIFGQVCPVTGKVSRHNGGC